MAEPRELDLPSFVRRLRYLLTEHPDCGLVWFLGAGCSVSSGIPTAAGLVRQWLPRLKQRETQTDGPWDQWAEDRFPGSAVDAGAAYGAVMDQLFPLQNERQREIERLTAEKDPGIGYALLALLMCQDTLGPQTNVVLTTNFDDLVQDAFYLVTPKKPLVVVHDSLAPFVRQSRTRPLIVKVHGDARLAPRNTVEETAELSAAMTSALANVLNDRALVFVGYGGNDQSIAGLMRALPRTTFQWGIYWVGEQFPAGAVGDALRGHQDLWWVPHLDFDALMLQIAEEFELGAPSFDRWTRLRDTYQRNLGAPGGHRSDALSPSEPAEHGSGANAAERMTALLRAGSLVGQARAMADEPDRADALYRQALEAAPDAADVLGSYAYFLHFIRHENDKAEDYYRRALKANPFQKNTLGNYGVFLFHVRRDLEHAEVHFLRALERDPSGVRKLANYAQLLFVLDRDQEARRLLAQAQAEDLAPAVRLELNFYLYAHGSEDGPGALSELRRLIVEGERSSGWDFSQTIERAVRDGHPEPDLLGDLAKVISDEASADILDRHDAWLAAVPKDE